ncbi:Cyclic di-GMP phosphodiesterase response regulator RpfG [Stratiformator vulcanicus]|uniref:Cyclic di-GMP phosphodiesterase response regulator RpfG n=1 Tax=Stratiformator vulcanicus TaxID=2527980 RepID=A0A517R730_9PLAN|nr:Cyclic di-GMP phosphodiesterase response regulator RpfG [Stratiformator vulcanicus]
MLLLAEGQIINDQFLAKLQARNIANVKVHKSELSRLASPSVQRTNQIPKPGAARQSAPNRSGVVTDAQNVMTQALDVEMSTAGALGLPPQGDPFAAALVEHGASGYDAEQFDQFNANANQSADHVTDIYNSLASGEGLDVQGLSEIADSAMSDLMGDSDLFACLGINPESGKYPARHSVHVGMLAIAIGTKLGLDEQTLRELSLGCLIHDAGMMKINTKGFSSSRHLNDIEFLEITKHPVVVFDMMKDMRAVSNRSAFIAYQIHERCDGSGYPRGRDATQIHFLSKVAAVADVYVALASPRPHRPAMLPYKAVEKILQDTRAGLFDPSAVRALLRTVSLFPLGSYVKLSDGREARVLRSNGEAFNSPTVEARSLEGTVEVVDLSQQPGDDGVRIVKAIAEFSEEFQKIVADAGGADDAVEDSDLDNWE